MLMTYTLVSTKTILKYWSVNFSSVPRVSHICLFLILTNLFNWTTSVRFAIQTILIVVPFLFFFFFFFFFFNFLWKDLEVNYLLELLIWQPCDHTEKWFDLLKN
jgi:hypothetical protein